MIINSIHAENVLKYSVLDLEDIPAQGLIAVVGDNESGKSSIGESICFALFGRTFSLGPDELDKVIRWGESRCSIRLEFTVPGGTRYRVARFLDKQGNHGASISIGGGDPLVRGCDEVEAKLRSVIGFGYTEFIESFYLAQREISTPNPHSAAVRAMAGVDAMQRAIGTCTTESDGFREQLRETAEERLGIDAELADLNLVEGRLEAMEAEQEALIAGVEEMHRQVRGIGDRSLLAKQMADRALREVKQWLEVGVGQSWRAYRRQGQRLDALLDQLEPVCADDPHIREPFAALRDFAAGAHEPVAAFDRVRGQAAEHAEALRVRLGDDSGDHAPAAVPATATADEASPAAPEATLSAQQRQLSQQQTQMLGEQRRWRWITLACLIGGLLLGGGYGFARFAAADPELARGLPLPLAVLPWLGIATAVLGVGAVGGWWYGARLGGRLRDNQQRQAEVSARQRTAREHIDRLSGLDDAALGEALVLLQQLDAPDLVSGAVEFAAGSGHVLLEEAAYRKHEHAFQQRVVALTRGMATSRDGMAAETTRLDHAIAEGSTARQGLQRDIEVEQERVRKYRELQALAGNLERRRADLGHRIAVRELGIDLLQGAIHYISQRFNTEVRNLSAEPLLKFTNGRYEHLQIDEDLNVKAFSSEKRDFMHLDEISSGTQRQIMLAVRMSLSQKLVNSVIQGPQALFLDEPFAFFDEDRTASALAVLPEVSRDFTQIWVTSQKFPPQSRFDITIECNAKESVSPWIRYADGCSPSA